MWIRPNRPASTARLRSCSVALSRFCFTTNKRTPALSQASTMSSPSCQWVAMGFSDITWTPARAQMIAFAGCSPLGVQIETRSGRTSDSMVARSSNRGVPAGMSSRSMAEVTESQTATSSRSSECSAMAWRCLPAMRPVPTTAIRILRSVIIGLYPYSDGGRSRDSIRRGSRLLRSDR